MEHKLGHDVELKQLLEDVFTEGREQEKPEFLGKPLESFVRGREDSSGGRTLDGAVLHVAPFHRVRQANALQGGAL